MKKLLTLLAVSALCFACSSSNDTPSDENLLIGKWYLSHQDGYSYAYGDREEYNESFTKDDTWLHSDVSVDGTMVLTNIEDPSEHIESPAKWSLRDRILTIEGEFKDDEGWLVNMVRPHTVKSLTATTIYLLEEGEDDHGHYEHNTIFIKRE